MTTHVPDGTADEAVDAIRTREAAHSAELATQGQLLRLWRPPLQPGEWRTLGLFAAEDARGLEAVLASMPLRVWRTDQVTPLSPHPNDPPSAGGPAATGPEFFTTFTLSVPDGTPAQTVEDVTAREAERAKALAEEGRLQRLWRLPGEGRSLGLWRSRDSEQMHDILESLPLRAWIVVETVPLSPHPSDPAQNDLGKDSDG
jgi:muconolactone delta-isomerase